MKIKTLISRKAFNLALIFGLISAVFISFADFDAACDDLRQNVLRLHIVANSDSVSDQQVKLAVRDEILCHSDEIFNSCDNIDDAVICLSDYCEKIERIANEVLREKGFSYQATAKIGDCYFETREYEDFTLPAGTYTSLMITLGKAEGKNWWCVIFPQVCIPAANSASLYDSTAENSARIAYSKNRYQMRFKAVEIYEKIKNSLK